MTKAVHFDLKSGEMDWLFSQPKLVLCLLGGFFHYYLYVLRIFVYIMTRLGVAILKNVRYSQATKTKGEHHHEEQHLL